MTKALVFSDETINSYGFYLKNDGAILDVYKKNPILLWMHKRASSWSGSKDEVLPLGNVKDVKFNEAKQRWEATPEFDMDDKFAAEIARKWEKGVIRMCSAGIRAVETSSDPKLMKKGQTRETVTKWILKEISIVDIGANQNALALYDEDDELITLSDTEGGNIPVKLLTKNNANMELIKLADGTQLTVEQVQALYDKSATQATEITTLTDERDGLKTKVADFEKAAKDALTAEATKLVDEAVKDGRINATPDSDGKSGKESWLKFFENDHDGAKSALAAIPKRKSIAADLADKGSKTEREELAKLSWDELDRSGKLETVKANYYDLYEEKFEKEFNRKPKKTE